MRGQLTQRFGAVERWGMSFWDALLWATANLHGVPTIYTEDGQAAPELDGVRFVNPFDP